MRPTAKCSADRLPGAAGGFHGHEASLGRKARTKDHTPAPILFATSGEG